MLGFHFPAFMGAIGETTDRKAHGHKGYFGFGGSHHYFHTLKDQLDGVTPTILEELGEEMIEMFWQII